MNEITKCYSDCYLNRNIVNTRELRNNFAAKWHNNCNEKTQIIVNTLSYVLEDRLIIDYKFSLI